MYICCGNVKKDDGGNVNKDAMDGKHRSSLTRTIQTRAFWWPLIVLAFAYAICRFLFMLIPPIVPSIDVNASEGSPFYLELSLFLFL
ncbi:hypothetical protein Pint_05597 [Pistacia integerrima]|uniref:Uncharacterized protein n=1 Tax=Pistacia integerrima TaxID=434235 RepID=A0ACC0Z9B7_9ROSI|nr:hypothetical protein Pint_05597 [Pistacia integerrima]